MVHAALAQGASLVLALLVLGLGALAAHTFTHPAKPGSHNQPTHDGPGPGPAPASGPPMGWMSWSAFGCEVRCGLVGYDNCISEVMMREQAKIMVEDGYLAVGYNTVHLDDCWPELQRDPM